ncbi:MAG: hypothetical protein WKG00_31735 [Polyangiaceae bacterium]
MKQTASRASVAAVVAFLAAMSACNEPQPTPAASSAAPSAASAAAVVASASGSASPSASAAGSAAVGPQGLNALAGTWSGAYDARKGEIAQPDGVKDKHWKKDEGKTNVGAGTLTVRIGPDGVVEGEAKGPLGAQVLEGNTDGKVVGLRVRPKDPLASDGFSGTLVALPKDGALKGELKVAGPTADVIRHSTIELKKQ